MKKIDVAVVGATGAVGRAMLDILEQRNFPVGRLVPLASERSAGSAVEFKGEKIEVRSLSGFDFDNIDLSLFSAGGGVSIEHAPRAAAAGSVVVDNTSAFRMEDDVPLVVPEVNPHAISNRPRGIISNPNCSTIQMVVALAPLRRKADIRRIVVSTYQSVSGAGARAMEELRISARAILDGQNPPIGKKFAHQIGFNCIPQIDSFSDDGYTKEERKMMNETRKIFEDDKIRVTATCVRVPVFVGHGVSVNVEFEKRLTATEAASLLKEAPGVEVVDDPARLAYPLQTNCAGKDPVFVGRIRNDPSQENTLDLWIVADNVRKGAALNAVQIGEVVFKGKTN